MVDRKILIVEDDPDIVEVLQFNLHREGFKTFAAKDGRQGLKLAKPESVHVILLDLMLPYISGLELCELLKQDKATKSIPIIILTAKGEESDVVAGLNMGADDYVVKPFRAKELIARIRAVIRRTDLDDSQQDLNLICRGPLVINTGKYEAAIDNTPLALTLSEFRLLATLASRPGRVFTRDQLINQVRGSDISIVDRNVDVHIASLRRKLKRHADWIITVRGVGYRFKDK